MKTVVYKGSGAAGFHDRLLAELDTNESKSGKVATLSATTDEKSREEFKEIWTDALSKAEASFHFSVKELWQDIFERLAETSGDDDDDSAFRGAHPGNAIKLFVERTASPKGGNGTGTANQEEAQELLMRMKDIYRAASINSEGLRKIVKKFDKNKNARLSSKLLPILYTSSLYTGQKMIEDSIGLIRDLISASSSSSDTSEQTGRDGLPVTFKPMVKSNSEFRHQESVEVRMQEMEWLKKLVESIPADTLLPHLVAHRGFHHIKDRNDKRPLENSLSAYEIAWTSGIQLCECDIALTKDEKLVLAHDENFARLSLDNGRSVNSKRKIGDLTFKELISIPLLSGVRPPLLIDVLRSAIAISDKSQLIIEIKPGNDIAAFALARMLTRHSDLRKGVAMIMSFDAATMHRLREELVRALVVSPETEADSGDLSIRNDLSTLSHQHRRVTSYDHFGTMGMLGSHSRNPSAMDLGNIGLSLSQANLIDVASSHPSGAGNGVDPQIPRTIVHSTGRVHLAGPSLSSLSPSMPKLMLLTVADPPKIPCELQVKCNELHRVDSWLSTEEGSLDGVYLQFEKEMMTKEGASYLRELSQRYMVGIWGYSGKDPDDFSTFDWLVREGNCSFVNTDLPKHFKPDVFARSGQPAL
jgi:glycerophosphoryl diester phosphodiesterase